MKKVETITLAQLPAIRQIVDDEKWLEAERRGCWVDADDRSVRENVCLVCSASARGYAKRWSGVCGKGLLRAIESKARA